MSRNGNWKFNLRPPEVIGTYNWTANETKRFSRCFSFWQATHTPNRPPVQNSIWMSAKDSIARLCHDQIEGTDNMGWPRKICYYWDNDSAGLSCGYLNKRTLFLKSNRNNNRPLTDRQSFPVWKVKPMRKCLKPAFFLMARMGRLYWYWKEV